MAKKYERTIAEANAARAAAKAERVRETHRLAETCVTCGRGGIARRMRGSVEKPGLCPECSVPLEGCAGCQRSKMGRCGDHVDVGRGLELDEIAARMGARKATVYGWLKDPDGSQARARRARTEFGECAECGGPTSRPDLYRCAWCDRGEVSPHRRETSPTGFRSFEPVTCGRPGCEEPRREGGYVCEGHAPFYAAIREDLARDRAARKKDPARALRVEHDYPAAMAA